MKSASDLRDIRNSLGITQFEMAGILGLDPGTYSMIEINRRHLGGKHLDRLILLGQILHQAQPPEPAESTDHDTVLKQKVIDDMLIPARAEWIRKESARDKKERKQSARPRLTFLLDHFDQMAHPDFDPETDMALAKTIASTRNPNEAPSVSPEDQYKKELEAELLQLQIEFLERKRKEA
jgi:transcriptional regulator with XRE-family HTH domain